MLLPSTKFIVLSTLPHHFDSLWAICPIGSRPKTLGLTRVTVNRSSTLSMTPEMSPRLIALMSKYSTSLGGKRHAFFTSSNEMLCSNDREKANSSSAKIVIFCFRNSSLATRTGCSTILSEDALHTASNWSRFPVLKASKSSSNHSCSVPRKEWTIAWERTSPKL